MKRIFPLFVRIGAASRGNAGYHGKALVFRAARNFDHTRLARASPCDSMLFISFAVTPIIVDVEVLARRRKGGVPQIVTH
jgi:hypothetical protein